MGRLLIVRPEKALEQALRGDPSLSQHVDCCEGNIEAVRRIRGRPVDVLLTDPLTTVTEDLALAAELRETQPGIRIIVLAPAASHDDVVSALKAHVFACFTAPFEHSEVVAMARAALDAANWRDGIEVVSGLPYWITLRVSCQLLTAERLVRFMTEHASTLPKDNRDLLLTAFHEMLLNAMEHGAGFDPAKIIEVTAAQTAAGDRLSLPRPRRRLRSRRSRSRSRLDESGRRCQERRAPRRAGPPSGRVRPPDRAADRRRAGLQRAGQRGAADQAPRLRGRRDAERTATERNYHSASVAELSGAVANLCAFVVL